MKVIFFLKGAARLDWQVPETNPPFNFGMAVKMIRSDGQFLADGVYIQASEIAAMLLDHSDGAFDASSNGPNVGFQHKNKINRLMS